MNFILTSLLIGALLSWILTLHYQAKLVELQSELADLERQRIADLGVMSQDYEQVLRKMQGENDMLRRRLG